MKFATAALLSLSGAAIAASSYSAPAMAPTETPCPSTGDGYMPPGSMAGSAPTPPPVPTETPCAKTEDPYTPASPVSDTVPPTGGYEATPAPSPEAYTATPISPVSPVYTPPTPAPTPEAYTAPPVMPITNTETPEEPCEKDAPTSPAGEAYTVRTTARQAVTYTDEAGVDYYMDSNGQWWYYPSPTPMPTPEPTPEPAGPGSEISLGDLEGSSSGDNSVTVGATEDMAAGAANGMNGAMAAAAVSPSSPGAIGLAF